MVVEHGHYESQVFRDDDIFLWIQNRDLTFQLCSKPLCFWGASEIKVRYFLRQKAVGALGRHDVSDNTVNDCQNIAITWARSVLLKIWLGLAIRRLR